MPSYLYGQSIDSHKKRITQIEKDIAYLNNQISSTQKKHKNTMQELVFIQKKVSNRREILKELDLELKEQNRQIAAKNNSIAKLEQRLDTLEHYYKHLIVNTYKHRDSRIWFMYILASDNIEQGYRRWKYLKNYSEAINKQGEQILETKQELNNQKSELLNLRAQTLKSQQAREKEYNNLLKEESKSKAYAKTLSKNQTKYKKQMEQKKKEAERLNREIEKMLAAAVKDKNSPKETPAAKADNIKLSSEFQNNKGKLPWPVSGGVIIEKFGQHYHPLFKSVKMPFNNGINISTSAGNKVECVFNGTVKQVIAIPGYNQCVLIQHGNYFTFYCKLANVTVKAGDKVATGQTIGTLSSSENTSTLHFELWHNTTKQNPELWLRK
ncbi:MAG: peptidoglycan DD-metalloendopeptidase family protein [Bacteroidales bacterium]|nr:peptidoglycan DD-metalloendopeptidase family protein [Bacteroidales bacterium]